MSAERKIQRAQSGAKQRRKSTSHLMEGVRSASTGSLTSITSTANNDINNIRHLSEPAARKDSKASLSRNSSSFSNVRQRKYSEVTPPRKYHDYSPTPVYSQSKSLDNSALPLATQMSVTNSYQSYLYSNEREVTIEEEQQSRIMHLYQVIMLWKKRWKQMRDHNLLLAEKLETMEHEYRGVCNSLKEIYEKKLHRMKEDVRKASKGRDEMLKEKRSLESSFKHMLEHSKMEKGEFEAQISKQKSENQSLKDTLTDLNGKLQGMREILEEYAKKDANNNEISIHNKSLSEENKNLANKLKSMEIELKEANIRDETYKLLVDTSLDRVKLLEQCVPKRFRAKNWKSPSPIGRYVMRVDHTEPVQMYLEDLDHINNQKLDTQSNQSLDSLDSLESIPEHLGDQVDNFNDGILATPGNSLPSSYSSVPPDYKEALKLSDSTNSGMSAMSSGGRSSYPSNIGSTCSTPSVFSDCQSPILNPTSPEGHHLTKSRNSRKHVPLQKSFTADCEVTPMNSPGSVRSANGISPDTIDIRDAIHSVPDLRQFNQSLSPDTSGVLITQSASQLPTTSSADEEIYTNHVRKGSMDSDILLSDTMKKRKKKNKPTHQRRGSLDFDMLIGTSSQKTPKPSRFDFLKGSKNGIIDDDKGKRKSKASEFADIFRKLTSSSTNLHDTEKKQGGFQKKRKTRSLKEKR